MRKILKIRIVVIFAAVFLGGIFLVVNYTKNKKEKTEEIYQSPTSEDFVTTPEIQDNQEGMEDKDSEEIVPEKFSIYVPFAVQAPFGVWDERHEEACEEASLIMLKFYLDNRELTAEIAEKEIQKMIEFEIEQYGDYKDTDAKETAKLFEDFYGKKLKVIYDFSKDDIKKYLAEGRPIIVPAAGRLLGNPYFTPPGPLYHNLVLVGYDGETIIANDPGTKKGEGYRYSLDVLYGAIHDFPRKKEDIEKGRKAMLVLE